jgi:hypothetical protein
MRLYYLNVLPVHGLAVKLFNGLSGSTFLRHLDKGKTPGASRDPVRDQMHRDNFSNR